MLAARKVREKLGLRPENVVVGTGISLKTISNFELGKTKPTSETLEKLADYYGVSVDEILGREVPCR